MASKKAKPEVGPAGKQYTLHGSYKSFAPNSVLHAPRDISPAEEAHLLKHGALTEIAGVPDELEELVVDDEA